MHATTDVFSSNKWHVYISKSNGSEGGSPFCFSQCNHLLYAYSCELHPRFSSVHRRLQSCVSTRARLRYAAFDAQRKRILSLHCTLYGRLTCYMLVTTCLRVRSSWYEYASKPGQCPGIPGPAGAYGSVTTDEYWQCRDRTGWRSYYRKLPKVRPLQANALPTL